MSAAPTSGATVTGTPTAVPQSPLASPSSHEEKVDIMARLPSVTPLLACLATLQYVSSSSSGDGLGVGMASRFGSGGSERDGRLILEWTNVGVRMSLERPSSVQASVLLPADQFGEYKLINPPVTLCIDFDTFCECSRVFGNAGFHKAGGAAGSDSSAASLGAVDTVFAYQRRGALVTILNRGNMTTQCSISTYSSPSMGSLFDADLDEDDEEVAPTRIDYAAHLRRSPVVSTFVVNATLLREAANDLDWSARYAELKFSPSGSPNFSLSMSSEQTGVSVSISWPRSSEIFQTFDAKQS
eukprot:CAMPEP_0170748694 /NCGR_PEP_ID=MMETSP0437-20130122/10001_1 /TAXON_ID=0 /ORGANISM="Sexangularia sp." /LENGTH=298 /DNA_ID=CAMNT_0011087573 /DNA_START=42 /DNA_END=934 /DNA_ORIENTATION=-